MTVVRDVWLLCRSLRSASLRSRWQFVNLLCFRIAFFFTLYEVFACRITVYWKNSALHCHFGRRKPLLPQWRNLSYRYVFVGFFYIDCLILIPFNHQIFPFRVLWVYQFVFFSPAPTLQLFFSCYCSINIWSTFYIY